MNPSIDRNHVDAVGADFETLGNEHRLQFVWPIFKTNDDSYYLIEGESLDHLGNYAITRAVNLDELGSVFETHIAMDASNGLIAVGPEYLRLAAAAAIDDVAYAAFLMWVDSKSVVDASGFHYSPISAARYEELARRLATQAVELFDAALRDARARFVSDRAQVALALFEAQPELPYESRATRRLLVYRITKDFERYEASLLTAAARLDISAELLEESVTRSTSVLEEVVPFEYAIRQRAGTLVESQVDRDYVNLVADERSVPALELLRVLGEEGVKPDDVKL